MHLPNDIASCHVLIKAQETRIRELEAQLSVIAVLQEKIAELEARLNQNSSNSHRAPSSDGLSKKPALPRQKGKKRGGQPGHPGKTLKMVEQADVVVEHAPEQCACGRQLGDVSKQTLERRQVFDLPKPKLEVTEHRLQLCICPDCHRVQTGQFPQEVSAHVQYGSGVRSLSVLLNNSYRLSFSSIRQFFSDVFGYALNESTQVTANETCYEALADSEQVIRKELLASDVDHFDETGMRVDGKLHWLHTCSNEKFTHLFLHEKRGKEALDSAASVLAHYQGWAVHDCWSPYFSYKQCRHAVCGAHLLRELQGLLEQGSRWADLMQDVLLDAYVQSQEGQGVVADFDSISRRYDHICHMADEEEPPPIQQYPNKRPKKSKGRNLFERLVQHKDAVLAFAQYPEVPFTNNQAERDIRPAKVKQKIAGCFRTVKGAQVYARIQSFISTARKQQLNVFNELIASFKGANFLSLSVGAK